MSDKKHIDRIFQEKLKDFEVTPNPKVWQNIQGQLNNQEPKKGMPIWLRYAGIAALLLLLVTIGGLLLTNNSTETKAVDIEQTSPSIDTKNAKGSDNQTPSSITDNGTNSDLENEKSSSNSKPLTDDSNQKPNASIVNGNTTPQKDVEGYSNTNAISNKANVTPIADNNQKSPKNQEGQETIANTNSEESSTAVDVNRVSKATNNQPRQNQNKETPLSSKTTIENSVATHVTPDDKTNPSQTQRVKNKNNATEYPSQLKNEREAVTVTNNSNKASKNMREKRSENKSAIASSSTSKNSADDKIDALKKDLSISSIVENTDLKTFANDSLIIPQLNITNSLSIEEAIAQTEDIIEEEKLVDRWQVYTNVAPVYYNTLGKGSHIDEQFVSNKKSGEVNTSYGVSVSYALSKKFAIRSGVNKLNLSYDTDNVILYETVSNNTSPGPSPLKNITLSVGNESLTALSADNLGVQRVDGLFNYNAAISQRMSYYEVPVEAQYKLVNNPRFALDVIGGFSTFLLDDNQVYSEFEEYRTYIGEANNVNSMSFSGNFGFGIVYKFSEKFKFNLEPTFKYQFNAFENTSGNFKPYIIGAYTGFSYRF